jgi:hypothetical protein
MEENKEKTVDINEVHHISLGIRHKEIQWKLWKNTGWRSTVEGLDWLKHNKAKIPLNKEQTPEQWSTRM